MRQQALLRMKIQPAAAGGAQGSLLAGADVCCLSRIAWTMPALAAAGDRFVQDVSIDE